MGNKADFYKFLCSLPNVTQKDDWWCCTQCVLCGDSKKDPNKKRLYINCDPTKPDDPVWYKCFNCNACSVLTKAMLNDICSGVKYDQAQTLRQINNAAMSNDGTVKVNKYQNKKTIPVTFPNLSTKPYLLAKYRYLCDTRLGYRIPIEDFQQLKIVWSLKDFISVNHIELQDSAVSPAILERDYIGFTSVRNEYILFRDTTNSNKYRWFKYNLFGMHGNLNSYYAIHNTINVLKPVNIIVAEGILDTQSILYNLYGGIPGNNIFLSTCNGAFEEPIRFYFSKGVVGGDVEVHCYIDNDTKYNFRKMRDRLTPFVMSKKNIKLFHNTKRKDFGYPKSDIEVEEIIY